MLMAGLLRNHIASRFNMNPSDLLIGPPGQAEGLGPDPMAWLVAGLTEDQATALLDIQALVFDTLTAFFFPYSLPISGFVGTFYGFTIPSDNDDLALTVIGDAAMVDPAITCFICAHRDAFPPDMTADEVLTQIRESMWVAPIPLLSLHSVPFTARNMYFGYATLISIPTCHAYADVLQDPPRRRVNIFLKPFAPSSPSSSSTPLSMARGVSSIAPPLLPLPQHRPSYQSLPLP
jgi:hypothetical protein